MESERDVQADRDTQRREIERERVGDGKEERERQAESNTQDRYRKRESEPAPVARQKRCCFASVPHSRGLFPFISLSLFGHSERQNVT